MLLVLVQAVLIVLCIGNTIFSLSSQNGDLESLGISNMVVYITNMIMYVSILIYTFWGFEHSIVPYRCAIIAYYVTVSASLVRTLDAEPEKTAALKTVAVALEIVLLILMTGFDNTFKKHKKAAKILGWILIAAELGRTVLTLIVSSSKDVSEIAALQPSGRLIAIAALVVTYLARCHWSKNGKIDFFEE